MLHNSRSEWSIATWEALNESHKQNVEGKKPDPNGYILNDFIYRLQKNRQTNPSLFTLRPMVTAGDRGWGGGSEGGWGALGIPECSVS